MDPFETYGELLDAVEETDLSYSVRNYAPTGQPIIDVQAGGSKSPAVFVTAGAHATEQAGVRAAVEVLSRIETNHEVHVIPSRDPIGLNGYSYVLSRITGSDVTVRSFDHLEEFLLEKGHVVHRNDDVILSLISDVGFATKRPDPSGDSSQLALLKHLKKIQHEEPELLVPFRGRRIILPAGQQGIPGSGDLSRAYTLVVGPEGQLLHLNRFFDTPWAPPEVEATRAVLHEIQPGLSFDLHETQLIDDRFYFTVNQHGTDERLEETLGQKIRATTTDLGADLATDADVARVKNITVADPDETPDRHPEGLTRLSNGWFFDPDPNAGTEGLNAGHLEAREYGPSIVTETGMWGDFDDRVRILTAVVEAGIAAFEAHHN